VETTSFVVQTEEVWVRSAALEVQLPMLVVLTTLEEGLKHELSRLTPPSHYNLGL
jgi:hypothetical protein